ncbi:MAG: hypothetical protein ACYTED_11890 [Planctomycetota bacterium]
MRIRLFVFLLGIALIYLGFRAVQERGIAKQWSQELTCAQLAADGPGDNAHIELTEFMLCDFDFVFASEGNEWTDAWVPIFPRNGAYHEEVQRIRDVEGEHAKVPGPTGFRVLVYFPSLKGRGDVQRAAGQQRLRGVVTNELDPLSDDEEAFLKKTYPSLDLDRVWIYQLDRRPPSLGQLGGLFGGGFLVLLAGGLWWYVSRRRQTYDPHPEPYRMAPPPQRHAPHARPMARTQWRR